ncbi:MAG: HlyD family efflux transporter periplasmic adaptor subunit [Pseudomonadota bacterium]
MRSLAGIFLLGLTVGLLSYAGYSFYSGIEARSQDEGRGRAARERVFTATTDVLRLQTATPDITAFGEVTSRRSLEIRTATGGRVLELAPQFRDGGEVAEGDVLLRIDPANAESAVAVAEADLAEARAEATETRTRVVLAEADLRASEQTRDLRLQSLERQQAIQNRGAGTSTAVEDAEIALASAEQAVVGRQQALAQAQSARELAEITINRRAIALADAERALVDTVVRAPFDGLLSAADALPGGMMSANERIGTLTDVASLEVSFRVTTAQFSRLRGSVIGTEVEATLDLGDIPLTLRGTVDRAGSAVGEGLTGRVLYAQVEGGDAILRPGDFLTVTLPEPALSDVAVLPATAIDTNGELLVVGEEDRLEPVQVTVLRRQGDDVIVSGAPEGQTYVLARGPQLGEGVRIRPLTITPDAEAPADVTPAVAETAAMDLEPERRARLIAFVEGNRRMPEEVKARLLSQLEAPQVPLQVVERLERRMGG